MKKPANTSTRRSIRMIGLAGNLLKEEAGRAWNRVRGGSTEDSLLQARLKQATLFVQELAHLKGGAMKLGQLLALEARDFFPEEVVQILEKLQNTASFLDYSVITEILERELGGRFSDFQDFSEKPIAAASIGQVHSAQLWGQSVVVKVQYPGIGDSLESDLKILKKLVGTVSILTGKKETDYSPLFSELKDVFLQETDYLLEGSLMEEYARKAVSIPELTVPKLFSSHSTRRVLTLSHEDGVTLPEALKKKLLSAEKKKFFASIFLNLYVREFCEWGLVQTDPNLGNFLISPDNSRLVLLDFGATRRFSSDFIKEYSELICSAIEKDGKKCLELIFKMKLIDEREELSAQRALLDLLNRSMDPFRVPEYDFSENSYTISMRQLGRELVQKLKFSPPPKNIIFLHRKLGGIFQIIRRLEVKMDLRPFLESFKKAQL